MSEAYWTCSHAALDRGTLFLISGIMNGVGLIINLILLVLLFLLKCKTRIFIFQLRALIASNFLCSLIRIASLYLPTDLLYRPSLFGWIVCHLWSSHYLLFVSYIFTILTLNFTVGNRAIQIVCKYQYSFSTSLIGDLAYFVGLGLVSIIVMLPQAFIFQWDGENCTCLDTNLPYGIVVSKYAEVFARFGLTAVISVIILSISCYKIIFWVRNTPTKQLLDTWNLPSLPGTTTEHMESFSRPQGWMTATLCTVPFSITSLAVSVYQAGYRFVSALGLCSIQPDTPLYNIDRFLTDIEVVVLPIIVIVYIPALRELPWRVCQKVTS
ncbi:unnamed protein product, partial [Dibothriocephalus latus]